ncbi:MAG TPA: hypothetical protein VIS54_00695 [Psychromonas sp.]
MGTTSPSFILTNKVEQIFIQIGILRKPLEDASGLRAFILKVKAAKEKHWI